ncbi:peptidase domain-containing ABC transporter [Chitinophaga agrisoli]|uniref:Peptidase domain-containing ABC transporter n=1 Tax=Chitinophaga agrisoli TaxID=2607653 RepID=A0A5B2VY11_9BACT|nr:peptidase domain-containing ABC transporter [Chitinophaga agrisoli]KAA2243518.1 peptidase domain-containing ABC transporter [Chitinophaga agrisoli]
MLLNFPHYKQHDMMDCGPTCLMIISKYYGKLLNIENIRKLSDIGKTGVSLLGISKAAESMGIRAVGGKVTFDKMSDNAVLPCIAHWRRNHFVVVYKVSGNRVYVSDPASGLVKYSRDEFLENWAYTYQGQKAVGVILHLEPTPVFYRREDEAPRKGLGLKYLWDHVWHYKKLVIQLCLGILAGSVISLIFPFLTKGIIDIGIENNNLRFIYLILAGQLVLTAGQFFIDLVRGWVLLHITSRINITVLSDFLHKLMKLPLSFFDTKLTGDLLQRIEDHKRIEALLTGSSLNTLFSLLTLSVFSGILLHYSVSIFCIFFAGSAIYFLWLIVFLNKRKQLDFKRFETRAQNQAKTLQIINGIHEIKINDNGTQKIWDWERVQAKLFRLNLRSLSLNQYQQLGALFINQTKDIIIIFLAATAVLHGKLSIGDMMAIQFIIGQMNSPIMQMAGFLQVMQDARISIERLGQIHILDEEERPEMNLHGYLPVSRTVRFSDVSFAYPGAGNQLILKNINMTILQGCTTAIVGTSGSGKTTLFKLLLKTYAPNEGRILIGNDMDFRNISPKYWRNQCGIVMQDGFIFSDTIAGNIIMGDEHPDPDKIDNALTVANLHQFVSDLPLGLNTKIGADGKGISGGQKQRILIARVVYKNPEYIFLDEATSALDANNEKMIIQHLNDFCKGKTVVVAAHRLSTVKNADNIVVLHKGEIVEQGKHHELVQLQGHYYHLIKNQLELGS